MIVVIRMVDGDDCKWSPVIIVVAEDDGCAYDCLVQLIMVNEQLAVKLVDGVMINCKLY